MRRPLTFATLLLFFALLAGLAPVWAVTERPSRAVEIRARRFEFVPAELTLKRGEPVTLRVTSEDATHGLYLRAFHIDEDLVPGTTREIRFTPETPGTFVAICHHFCGAQHGNMRLTIVVE